jgi:hypothetical protein
VIVGALPSLARAAAATYNGVSGVIWPTAPRWRSTNLRFSELAAAA